MPDNSSSIKRLEALNERLKKEEKLDCIKASEACEK